LDNGQEAPGQKHLQVTSATVNRGHEHLLVADWGIVKGNGRAGTAFANQVFLLLGQRLLRQILGVFATDIQQDLNCCVWAS
jgi:hypothetical protein